MSNYSVRETRKVRNNSTVLPRGFLSTSCRFNKDKRNGEGECPRIIDVLEQLKEEVQERSKVEKENAALKLEISNLEFNNDNLRRMLDETITTHEQELSQLKKINADNREKLLESSTKFFVEQKKNFSEIDSLKKEIKEIKAKNEIKQKQDEDVIAKLQGEMSTLNGCYEDLKEEYQEYLEKSAKYKTKLKYAIYMINELNVVLKQLNQKPECVNIGVQMPDEECKFDISCGTTVTTNPETDDFLLSEIFFKSKNFCENELLRFNSDSSLNNVNS